MHMYQIRDIDRVDGFGEITLYHEKKVKFADIFEVELEKLNGDPDAIELVVDVLKQKYGFTSPEAEYAEDVEVEYSFESGKYIVWR